MKTMKFLSATIWIFFAIQAALQSQNLTPADITIDRDGTILQGKFYQANGDGMLPTVILLQGSPGNPTDVLGLGKIISGSGINAMTFNYSGTHKSEGMLSFPNCLADIKAAYKFLRSPESIRRYKIDTTRIILAGYSFGGGMAMTYAIKHPEISTVISIAGNDWGEFFEEYLKNPAVRNSIDASLEKSVSAGILRFEPGMMPKDMAASIMEKLDPDFYTKRNALMLGNKDILILCGWDDQGVTIDRYILPLYRALKQNNGQIIQLTAFQDDHTFSKSRSQIAQTMVEWIKSAPERSKR